MKSKVLGIFLLLSILITGCGNEAVENLETIEQSGTSEILEATEQDMQIEESLTSSDEAEQAETTSTEADSSNELNTELVEYSYEDLYLSVEIPEGWEYEIQTAEELAMEDGLVTCAIEFWSVEFPDTVFELGFYPQFGLCLTGVTVEDFSLSNGLGGYRYTQILDDIFWMNIAIHNPNNNVSGGSYVVSAMPELIVWEYVKEEFKQILDTIWVGPKAK